MRVSLFSLLLHIGFVTQSQVNQASFVYITDVIPSVVLDIRYYSEDNFVGARVDGYLSPVALLTKEATDALIKVQQEFIHQIDHLLNVFFASCLDSGMHVFQRKGNQS